MKKTDNHKVKLKISAPAGTGCQRVAAVVADALRSAGALVSVSPNGAPLDTDSDAARAHLMSDATPVTEVEVMINQEPQPGSVAAAGFSWPDRFMDHILMAEEEFADSGPQPKRGIVAVRVTRDLADALRYAAPPFRGIRTQFGMISIETDEPQKRGEPEPGGPDGDDRVIGVRVGDLRAFESAVRDHAFAMVERMRAEDALSRQGSAAKLAREDEDRKMVLVAAAARKMHDRK